MQGYGATQKKFLQTKKLWSVLIGICMLQKTVQTRQMTLNNLVKNLYSSTQISCKNYASKKTDERSDWCLLTKWTSTVCQLACTSEVMATCLWTIVNKLNGVYWKLYLILTSPPGWPSLTKEFYTIFNGLSTTKYDELYKRKRTLFPLSAVLCTLILGLAAVSPHKFPEQLLTHSYLCTLGQCKGNRCQTHQLH